MQLLKNYVLVLHQQAEDSPVLETLLERLRCSTFIAHSADQMIAKASQEPPYLVILAGNDQTWSYGLVNKLRGVANACGVTIVALTDCHAPSWLYQEENPGIDGFLVKPLSNDVLTSLIQSAWARQVCCL